MSVFIKSESRYPINRRAIRKKISQLFKEKGLTDEVELAVAVVGDRKMKALNQKYRGMVETTPVLAFPLEGRCRSVNELCYPEKARHPELDSGSINIDSCFRRNDVKGMMSFPSPDNVLRLGDIVISYPQARKLAAAEEKLMDEKINELIEYGMEKLLGNNF